ncbi:diphosphomevalonate decarboxylase-like [Saccostrea echinata]|uniref:diphosphomevalonate decarboxylase-like n=1 Tax=Saccostrea echinata TaxID=191078 RepID=UPI002A80CF84|nr:diphosphomevalonate decarboxylase-like [Saccostrea echinata]
MNIQDDMEWITCDSPVNIAVIKYWGKRDEKLILPLNSSVSITLNHEELRARTTVAISRNFNEDKMWLNGKEQSMKNARLQSVISQIKRLSRKRKTDCDQLDEKLQWKLHICSENNFPTAAGLASSAAGYACLVYALSKLYGINGDISKIARLGSGSACRSLYGGFVIWNKGESSDGEDSKAEQIAPETHWPELRILILVVSDQTKHTGSTVGMQTTVATSELLQQRLQTVPQKVDKIKQAILNKDFHSFAEITMKDSNQLHAVCLDTYPPVSYLTDTSHHIMQLVHAINEDNTSNMVAYSFDAGPNAFLFMQEKDVPTIINILRYFYPSSDPHFLRGLPVPEKDDYHVDYTTFIELKVVPRALKFVIYTKPGPEPSVKETDCGLLASDGLPKLHQ